MLGAESLSAQWYRVPPGGPVTFTLNEEWTVFKGPPAANTLMGDATVTLGYLDGVAQDIVFQSSGQAIYQALEHTSYISGEGTIAWSQVVSLPPGTEFRILSTTVAQAYDPTKPFEGGQSGAYVLGRVSRIATDATPANAVGTNPSGPVSPPTLVGGGTPLRIHAVIISGLSDPTKIIASPNIQLTGGIVALGKNTSSLVTPSAWSTGLEIIPDYALLTGKKIPPVTPNIIDIRIVRQDTTADFRSQTAQPTH
jgi:hypothetical protein